MLTSETDNSSFKRCNTALIRRYDDRPFNVDFCLIDRVLHCEADSGTHVSKMCSI